MKYDFKWSQLITFPLPTPKRQVGENNLIVQRLTIYIFLTFLLFPYLGLSIQTWYGWDCPCSWVSKKERVWEYECWGEEVNSMASDYGTSPNKPKEEERDKLQIGDEAVDWDNQALRSTRTGLQSWGLNRSGTKGWEIKEEVCSWEGELRRNLPDAWFGLWNPSHIRSTFGMWLALAMGQQHLWCKQGFKSTCTSSFALGASLPHGKACASLLETCSPANNQYQPPDI